MAKIKFSVFIVCLLFNTDTVFGEWDHSKHGHSEEFLGKVISVEDNINRENVVQKIIEITGSKRDEDSYMKNDIENLLKVLDVLDCQTMDDSSCKTCIDQDTTFSWLDIKEDEPLEKIEFLDALNLILLSILRSYNEIGLSCKQFSEKLFDEDQIDIFAEYVKLYGTNDYINKDSLTAIVDDIKKTFQNNFIVENCIDMDDVIDKMDLNYKELNLNDLRYFTAYIMYNLVSPACKPYKIPSKGLLIDDLFNIYGNSTHITPEGFKKIIAALKIGYKENERNNYIHHGVFRMKHDRTHDFHNNHNGHNGHDNDHLENDDEYDYKKKDDKDSHHDHDGHNEAHAEHNDNQNRHRNPHNENKRYHRTENEGHNEKHNHQNHGADHKYEVEESDKESDDHSAHGGHSDEDDHSDHKHHADHDSDSTHGETHDHSSHSDHKDHKVYREHDDHDDHSDHADHSDHSDHTDHSDQSIDGNDNENSKEVDNEQVDGAKMENKSENVPVKKSIYDDNHDDHGHDHKRKRRSNDGFEIIFDEDAFAHKRYRRSALKTKTCYSLESLLASFNIKPNTPLTRHQFYEISPALIQQIHSCQTYEDEAEEEDDHDHNHNHGKEKENTRNGDALTDWRPWTCSLLATAFVSLGSLCGIFAAPFYKKSFFSYLLIYLICLAVATLIGDAVLHLIPHSINIHGHKSKESHDDHSSESESDDHNIFGIDSFLWKFLLILGGIYLFFIFEIMMHTFSNKHGHSHKIEEEEDDDVDIDESKVPLTSSPLKSDEKAKLKEALDTTEETFIHYDPSNLSPTTPLSPSSSDHNCEPTGQCTKETIIPPSPTKSLGVRYNRSRESISSITESFSGSTSKLQTIKSVVWMVLLGDAIHNFVDGVAIGVAFSESFPAGLQGGISTSIAILCHELPHELGDFAVLISSGLSIKKALIMNFLSSLTAFAGTLIGVSIGTKWEATPWIFALTAGLFIYIALVDMLPEVLNSKLIKKRPYLTFALQNGGLLTGFIIMFALAGWEERIVSLLQ